eukprot:jgi/Hompol1/2318/HPOL_005938-RA
MAAASSAAASITDESPISQLSLLSSQSSSLSNARRRSKPTTCPGCGSTFQHHAPNAVGFVEPQVLDNFVSLTPAKVSSLMNSDRPLLPNELRLLLRAAKGSVPICKRCHELKHRNNPTAPANFKSDTKQFSNLKMQRGGIVVLITDAVDLPNTIVADLLTTVGPKKTIIAINKTDLLPAAKYNHTAATLSKWIRLQSKVGASAVEIVPVSAHTGAGVADLASAIGRHRLPNEDVYMIGVTNAGKSSLINKLLDLAGQDGFLTTSSFAGTTIAPIGMPLASFGSMFVDPSVPDAIERASIAGSDTGRLFDTAGIFNPVQLTHHLTNAEMTVAVPKKQILPKRIKIRPKSYYVLGALVRICIEETYTPCIMWFFGSPSLPIHRCRTKKLNELWEKHAGVSKQLLTPPYGKKRIEAMPPFKKALKIDSNPTEAPIRVWIAYEAPRRSSTYRRRSSIRPPQSAAELEQNEGTSSKKLEQIPETERIRRAILTLRHNVE